MNDIYSSIDSTPTVPAETEPVQAAPAIEEATPEAPVEAIAVAPIEAAPIPIAEKRMLSNFERKLTILDHGLDAKGNCPMCGFDICTVVAHTEGDPTNVASILPIHQCHQCDSYWIPDVASVEPVESQNEDGVRILEFQLSHAANVIESLTGLFVGMKPGEEIHVRDRFVTNQSLDTLDYQHFFDNTRVVPTKDGLAIAARFVGFELVEQSPVIILRKPVQ